MKLKPAPNGYDRRDQQDLRNELDDRDNLTVKKDRDAELRPGARFIISSPNGTRFAITVDNAGVISGTAV